MSERTESLLDGVTRKPIPAVVRRDLTAETVDAIEVIWKPVRQRGVERLRQKGQEQLAGHGHWDWRNQSGRVSSGYYNLVGIECGGDWQGLMAVCRRPRKARLAAAELVYVDYLEAAPWNYRPFGDVPRFLAVGSVLLAEAVQLSRELGLEGRVGLHSLEEAESFYENKIGMTRVGPDPDYYELAYFEFTVEQAARHLPSGR